MRRGRAQFPHRDHKSIGSTEGLLGARRGAKRFPLEVCKFTKMPSLLENGNREVTSRDCTNKIRKGVGSVNCGAEYTLAIFTPILCTWVELHARHPDSTSMSLPLPLCLFSPCLSPLCLCLCLSFLPFLTASLFLALSSQSANEETKARR